jgi:predicted amidohydrolase YtcJ
MKFTIFAAALAIMANLFALLLAGCTSGSPAQEPLPTVNPAQEIVFHNGVILTMNDEKPQAQALGIRGEKITAVGDNEAVLAAAGSEATRIDLGGATLMPGFVDAHTHLLNDAEQYFDMSLAEVQQVALENGITTIGNMYVDSRFLKEIQSFAPALRLRASLYLVMTDNCGKPLSSWYREYPPTRNPGEMLRIGGVKIFADGGTCKEPAISYEITPGDGFGDLFLEQEDLNDMVREAQEAGYQVAIHAIGDRAIEQAQNAIAAALDGQPNNSRHRIEHNSVIRPELLPRYGELGIIPVLFGPYAFCEPFGPPPPEAYQAWEWPWRALLDANPGLPVAWHGDDPFFGRVRPLDDLYSLVTRNEIGKDGRICEAPLWHRQHTIMVEEALRMMTTNAAYALFRDEEVGRLAPGYFADLIILSTNPLAVDPEDIAEMNVWLTMIGGRVEHCAQGHENLCP